MAGNAAGTFIALFPWDDITMKRSPEEVML